MPHNKSKEFAIGYLLIPSIINTLVTGVLAVLTIADGAPMKVWGYPRSIFFELNAANFFLPLLTAWFVYRSVETPKNQLRGPTSSVLIPIVTRLSRLLRCGSWQRSLQFAILMGLILSLPAYAISAITEAIAGPHVSPVGFIAGKTSYAIVLGLIITPLVAYSAMQSITDDI